MTTTKTIDMSAEEFNMTLAKGLRVRDDKSLFFAEAYHKSRVEAEIEKKESEFLNKLRKLYYSNQLFIDGGDIDFEDWAKQLLKQ